MKFSSLPGDAGPEKGAPYETESGKFFRPAQTDVKNIAGQYLQENAGGHNNKEGPRKGPFKNQ